MLPLLVTKAENFHLMHLDFLPLTRIMDQDRIISTEVAGKTHTTLEDIPEDIAALIADSIKGWARIEGDLDEREKARRLRDSALRAVALSCRRSLEIYRPILWQNITLDLRHVYSFRQALQGDERSASSTRSLHFKNTGEFGAEEQHLINSQIASASSLNSEDLDAQMLNGMLEILKVIYEKLVHLQSLIILNAVFIPPSFEHLSCFSTTLKKLFIPLSNHSDSHERLGAPLTARNVIWLLNFGVIDEAALGFTIGSNDFKFLQEHHEYFSETSKVRKLSLLFKFVYKKWDRKTWWGFSTKEENDRFKHGNRKSEAIALLLNVVNDQLQCLELYLAPDEDRNPGDQSELSFRCLLGLRKSLGTLQHLRLVNCFAEKLSDEFPPFPLFRCLKTLSFEFIFLYSLVSLNKIKTFKLPASLERIILAYYVGSEVQIPLGEDKLLAQVVNSKVLPNLKEVIVPSTAVGFSGKEVEDSDGLKLWAQRRRELENEAVFKSGKVKLTKAHRGCSVIPDSQTFMSHLQWLSPPF